MVRPEDPWSSLSEQTVVSGSVNDLPGRAGAPTTAPPRRGRALAARPAVPGAVGELIVLYQIPQPIAFATADASITAGSNV